MSRRMCARVITWCVHRLWLFGQERFNVCDELLAVALEVDGVGFESHRAQARLALATQHNAGRHRLRASMHNDKLPTCTSQTKTTHRYVQLTSGVRRQQQIVLTLYVSVFVLNLKM